MEAEMSEKENRVIVWTAEEGADNSRVLLIMHDEWADGTDGPIHRSTDRHTRVNHVSPTLVFRIQWYASQVAPVVPGGRLSKGSLLPLLPRLPIHVLCSLTFS